MPKLTPRVEADACFLNIPYDKAFENLYLAYIVGLTALGFVPRATLGFPRDSSRLERIFALKAVDFLYMICLESSWIVTLHQLHDLTCLSSWDLRLHGQL